MAEQAIQRPTKAAIDLNKPARNQAELRQLFSRPDVIEQVRLTLPENMKPERLTKILLSACLQTPMLMEVNQLSLLQVLGKLAELGLEPGSAMGHVYLIPFRNKSAGRVDVNVIIGYRGYIELARRSGTIQQIETHVVFREDKFDCAFGLDPRLLHEPSWKGSREDKDALVVYGIVRMKDGGVHTDVMSMDEVRKIRNRSQAWKFKPNSGPWHDDFLEMARKTVVRRICKMLSLSAEVRELERQDLDNAVEGSVVRPDVPMPALPLPQQPEDDIASQMAAAKRDEPEDAEHEAYDATTGEVREPGSEEQQAAEPEAGTVDHLIWRIGRASAEEMDALKKEAFALPQGEPRRLDVSGAIKERTKGLAMKVQP